MSLEHASDEPHRDGERDPGGVEAGRRLRPGLIAYLSNFIPIPGGIGILDGSMIGMLVPYGISATTSTAAEVVYHAIDLWIPTTWGTIAFLLLRRSRREPLTLRATRQERRQLRAQRRQADVAG